MMRKMEVVQEGVVEDGVDRDGVAKRDYLRNIALNQKKARVFLHYRCNFSPYDFIHITIVFGTPVLPWRSCF